MDRRHALSALGSATLLGGPWAWRAPAHAQHRAHTQGTTVDARLVVVMLRGAMDGLSAVIPHGERSYATLRPNIAIPAPGQDAGASRLDDLFGLHPALSPVLMPWWQQGQLAFVHASGSPDLTRSHFDAQDYMETATPGRKTTVDGWLNRLVGALSRSQGQSTAPIESMRLRAVNLGPTTPRILTGTAPVASLPSGAAATARGALDRPQFAPAFAELYPGDDALSITVREAAATRKAILDTLTSDDPTADRGALSLNGFPADMQRLGQLMAKDARVRIAFAPVGGWDTHANQGSSSGQLANRFTALAQGLDALVRALGDQFANTTVLVNSEFGRTLRQNGTQGTDHGHGNVTMLIAGKGLAGGKVHGRWPGLDTSALHEGRDLSITTDFREVIATLLEQRFKLNDAALGQVLPSMPQRQSLPLFA
jgi:uncharacterized protein (DUF1501 family)